MDKRYNNYHKHTHISTLFATVDSNAHAIDYINRCKELCERNYWTTEHGTVGDVFEANTLCEQNNIHCKAALEGYIVTDPLSKNSNNYHILLIPRTNVARKRLNKANSRANKEGFYYKPRLFLEDILAFKKDELYITSACMAGLLSTEDSVDNILMPLINYFEDSVFLEVQNHEIEAQKDINRKAIALANGLGLKLICANDSHYIYPYEREERVELLKGKNINYGDEDIFILDYPDYETMVERFQKQGVLTDTQIEQGMETTLLLDNCEDIRLSREIKMPTIYKGKSDKEKINLLKKEVNIGFKKTIKEDDIPKEKQKKYIQELRKEMQVIEDTSEIHTSDYFLLNIKMLDLAINKYGGVLTRSGRGSCFLKDTLVLTDSGYKTIDQVNIGDKVIGDDCNWHSVINTTNFEINEPTLKIQYEKQGTAYKKYPSECTLYHKYLINRQGILQYIEAQELQIGDLLCSPKIKHNYKSSENEYIDLNEYNIYNYPFDDEYIYEKPKNTNFGYKYSPKWFKRNGYEISSSFCKKIISGYVPKNEYGIHLSERILEITKFQTIEDYIKYCKKHGSAKTIRIKRFLKKDMLFNVFVGMMYGDGWTQRDYAIAVATNNTTKKKNEQIAYWFANKLGLNSESIYVNIASNGKNLRQIYLNSRILNNYWRQTFFNSQREKSKTFNKTLLQQTQQNLKGLLYGLKISDGSASLTENKISFDNTSLSLIGAYSILDNIVNGFMPNMFNVREEHKDSRNHNWICKESYKIRRQIRKTVKYKIQEDDNFWYLPITKIEYINPANKTVYDLTVEGVHSYVVNNIVVHNCGAYLTNKMLGITQIDRLTVDLPIYPERFMSTERLLENHALPDIDYNVVSQEPFVKASRELLGETGVYPMIAYGTMKQSEAFRNICRSAGLPYNEYNDIAKKLDYYELDEKWGQYINQSKKYLGTIISASVHPCAHLLLDKDIEEEVGVVKVGDVMCAMITSDEADEYKYLKNDYLIVSVWGIIEQTFKMVGKSIPTIKELIASLDNKVWSLFSEGYTCTLNQVDSDYATALVKQYKPQTVEELAEFIGAIRPNFNDFRDDFINRRYFTNGSHDLDELFKQTQSFIIFQENLMQFFEWLGITPAESIGLIKKISKKKIKKSDFEVLTERLEDGWQKQVGNLNSFHQIWEKMQSMMSYGFNTPHGLAYAYDCLYCAYLKANYPLEYFTVTLNMYKDSQTKTERLTNESQHWNIKIKSPKFGYAHNEYMCDKESNTIYKGLGSIKNMQSIAADIMLKIAEHNPKTFLDILYLREEVKVNGKKLDARSLEILIDIGFFSNICTIAEAKTTLFWFNKYGAKKTLKKEKLTEPWILEIVEKNAGKETTAQFSQLNNRGIIEDILKKIPKKEEDITTLIRNQITYLGYADAEGMNISPLEYMVQSVREDKYNRVWMSLYQLSTGTTKDYKCDKSWYKKKPCKKGDVIKAVFKPKEKVKLVGKDNNGKNIWQKTGEYENILKYYSFI